MDILLARPGDPMNFTLILMLLMLFFGTITGILHLFRWLKRHPREDVADENLEHPVLHDDDLPHHHVV